MAWFAVGAQGLAKCGDCGEERHGDWATKVCCGVEKYADGAEGLEKCGGWATKVCCGAENCEDGVQASAKCGG